MKRPETPVLQELSRVRDKTIFLSQFLDWLDEQGIDLAERGGWHLTSINETKEQIIGRFFEIDPDALEAERVALLDYQRWLNDTDPCPKCEGKGEIEGDYHRDDRPCTNCDETGRVLIAQGLQQTRGE